MPIRKVEISYDTDWPRVMLGSINAAYGSAPFFDIYFTQLKDMIKDKTTLLFDYNLRILEYFLDTLRLSPSIGFTSDYIKEHDDDVDDLRDSIRLKPPGSTGLSYAQVFEDRYGFIDDCSILDLLMCMGPEASLLLRKTPAA